MSKAPFCLMPVLILAMFTASLPAAEKEAATNTPSLWSNIVPPAARARQYYVSPEGKKTNPGTKALSGGQTIPPGSVVWLRGGTYGKGGKTVFEIKLKGSKDKPIIIRQYPHERATINGGLELWGSHTWLWGFEVTNTDPLRKCGTKDRPGFNMYGRGSRLVNLIIHDVGHPAPGFWKGTGDGSEMHGVLMYHNGLYCTSGHYKGSPRGSLYAQSQQDGGGTKYITNCIAFRNFTQGIKPSSAGKAMINGFHMEGNVSFDHPWWNMHMAAKTQPMKRARLIANCTYRRRWDAKKGSVYLGHYGRAKHEDVELRDNYFVMGSDEDRAFYLKQWKDIVITGNTIVGLKALVRLDTHGDGKITCDNNAYYGASGQVFRLNDKSYDFAGWRKATGYDAKSTYSKSYPTGVKVFVRANKYEPGRGHVVVYNWDKKKQVEIDLSAILPKNAKFEIRDAQNYFGKPVVKGVYEGGSISIPMNLTEMAKPVGDCPHLAKYLKSHTAP